MRTLKINIQDSVFDKIIYFLRNLPKDEVEIVEDKKSVTYEKETQDFIAYLSANPIAFKGEFLTRDEANAR